MSRLGFEAVMLGNWNRAERSLRFADFVKLNFDLLDCGLSNRKPVRKLALSTV
jgi:hypothetical protein